MGTGRQLQDGHWAGEKEQNRGFGELQQGGLTPCPCAGCVGTGVAKASGAERGRWVTSSQVLPGLTGPALQRNRNCRN